DAVAVGIGGGAEHGGDVALDRDAARQCDRGQGRSGVRHRWASPTPTLTKRPRFPPFSNLNFPSLPTMSST
ncbi:MAG: hypothetical protein ACPGWQ_00050, partial [Poseidonia sp.]